MTDGRVDQATIGDSLRNHDERIRALEAIPQGTDLGQVIRGSVFNDGSIAEGTGFTVSDDGLVSGVTQYTITFTTPFVNPPVVVVAPNNNNPASTIGRYTATSLPPALTTAIIIITSNVDDPDSLGPQDGGFDFIAVEPAV